MQSLSLETLAKGRPKGEFNSALRRLGRLHLRDGDVHEVALRVWVRRLDSGKRRVSYSVRTGIAGRREISLASGKVKV